MMNTKISIFETFDSAPVTIPLDQWIQSTMNSESSYADKVLKYRETGDDSIKKSLPLATVGAVCEGGRKMEDVGSQTGWIALDIDYKDNTHYRAEVIRDQTAKIVYVAFSGLSVSGKGVWALVKVSDSRKQAHHFEKLQEDFLSKGIILDSTKGKNPNDARFYSFDPDAYISDDYKIYDRLPKPKPVKRENNYTPTFSDNTDIYGQAALNDELQILSSTGNGDRNNQLFKSTAALAGLVAGNVLREGEVRSSLFDAALSTGLPKYEIKRTINSGFKAGLKSPRKPTDNRQGVTPKTKDKHLEANLESDKKPGFQKTANRALK